jgi:spermidine synthase
LSPKRAIPRSLVWVACLAALISGVAGLAYEVVWARMLVVPLGNSADATALVLAAFMVGIAIGARLIGGLADRLRHPLSLYVTAELLLAACAVAMPFLVRSLGSPALGGSLEDDPGGAIARLALAALLVGIPSCLMGASVPVLVRGLSAGAGDVKRLLGVIYGIGTVGGALGAAIGGFVALPSFGATATSFLGAAGSATAGVMVAIAGRAWRGRIRTATGADDEPAEPPIPSRTIGLVALLVAGAGGFTMLAAEVLWARVLTFVFGHDTYAFAVLLVVVLLGLGLGGLLYRVLAAREPAQVAGLMLGLLGVTALLSYWCAAGLVVGLGRDPFDLAASGSLSTSLWLELYREILYTPILILLPAICAGASLPAAAALYAGPADRAGRRVGRAFLVNGVSAAAGALVTSFGLIPAIGIQPTMILIALVAVVAAFPASFLAWRASAVKRIALGGAPIAAALILAVVMQPDLPRAMLLEAVGARHQQILHYEEGRTGTVSVTENEINAERQLFLNAVNEVTTRLVHDQSFKALGHLGPLLHPRPEKGLMICFGAGISAGAALRHPLKRLDVVELSGAVPAAASLFEPQNNAVMNDPRFRLHIADGRQYLLRSDETYDVIMVDSTHPKAVDSWVLYTLEFYRLLEQHLADDGIAVQWVPLHGLSEQEFKIIVRTFSEAFPHVTVWVNAGFETYGPVAYVKLVGTRQPLTIDYKELALRLGEPRIKDDLEPYGMASPAAILSSFLASGASARAWTDGLPIQTDDRPFLPYITRYSEGRRMEAPLLAAARTSVVPLLKRMGEREPEILKELARAFEAQGFWLAGLLDRGGEAWPEAEMQRLFAERLATSRGYYTQLAERYPGDADKLFEIASYLGNLGHDEDAERLYREALELDPKSVRVRINLALTELDRGAIDEAARRIGEVVEDEPKNALGRYNLGVALLAAGDAGSAVSQLEQAVELAPDLMGARLSLADALLRLGRLKRSEAVLRELTERARWHADAWDMLGLVAAARKDWSAARRHHSRALILDPYRAESHYNIGIALYEEGRLDAAAQAYKAALRIHPGDAEALNNLGLVYAAAGLFELAIDAYGKAIDAEPRYPEALYNLGLAYRATGRIRQAAETFALALELAPDLEPAREQLDQLGVLDAEVTVEDAGPADEGTEADGGNPDPAPRPEGPR